MKKSLFLFTMIFLLIAGMVSAADAQQLTTSITKYEPYPAEPGKYVDVYIKIENLGVATAKNVILEVQPEFPFSLDPGKDNFKSMGSIGGSSYEVVKFTLKIDENAVEGTNNLKVRYNLDEAQTYWVEKDLPISIQTQDSVLAVDTIKTEPEEIAPGSVGSIRLDLSNQADSPLSNLKVKLDIGSSDTPFAPYNSATEKNIYLLNSGDTETVTFDIIAYPDAISQIYKIPINISYYDNVGTQYTKQEIVGVIVNSEPEIQVVIDSTNLQKEKTMGNVVLKIINKGLNDVKFMNLAIEETEDFEILSSTKEEYIGNLDSDDFETVEFTFLLKKNDGVQIPIHLEYKDNNNKQYHKDLNLNLKIYSAKQLGNAKSGYEWIIIVIILLVVGIFFYRKHKKKKQHHK